LILKIPGFSQWVDGFGTAVLGSKRNWANRIAGDLTILSNKMKQKSNRRDWIKSTAAASLTVASGAVVVGSALPSASAQTLRRSPDSDAPRVRYCFNTATLRGRKLPIKELVDLVSAAGYDGIEVWIDELDRYTGDGGDLSDLKKYIADKGLKVESAIAFANWLAADDAVAVKEVEKAKRDMQKVSDIGGVCIAAPPAGQNDTSISDWGLAAKRLSALAAAGKQVGVQPQLEVWGFSKSIGNISSALHLASMSDSDDFGILLDVYHLYKGGSPFEALRLVAGSCMKLFHINDYPAEPERSSIGDKDRVFPGDGVAPLDMILSTMFANGFQGVLSLELFNPEYWKQDPMWVVQTGLAKTKAAVERCS